MPDIAFLGPQFRDPNLQAALRLLGIDGPLVSITAGWQEREGELDELRNHVGTPVTDLALYQRAEQVFARDPQLHSAHRRRQGRLRELQDLYRLRLGHAKQAGKRGGPRSAPCGISITNICVSLSTSMRILTVSCGRWNARVSRRT